MDIQKQQQHALQPGLEINQMLRVLAWLGSGGMSEVYSAEHLQFHRQVAVKLLHRYLEVDADAGARLHREASAVAMLDHPNIIKVYSVGVHDGRPFITMELLPGCSLDDLLRRDGALKIERAMGIFNGILEGLGHAHSKGIVHRDLKPSNVMVLPDGAVKVLDFGLARILPESGKELQKLTQTGQLLGTVQYMSPEQLMGGQVDARSDLYALGCVMFETLTGKAAFDGADSFEILTKHLTGLPEQPEQIDDSMWALINLLLSKQPEKRPASGAAVKELLAHPELIPKVKATRGSNLRLRKLVPALLAAAMVSLVVLGVFKPWEKPAVSPGAEQTFHFHQNGVERTVSSAEEALAGIEQEGRRAARAGNSDLMLAVRGETLDVYRLTGRTRELIPVAREAFNEPVPERFSPGWENYTRAAGNYLLDSEPAVGVELLERSFGHMQKHLNGHLGTWQASCRSLGNAYLRVNEFAKAHKLLAELERVTQEMPQSPTIDFIVDPPPAKSGHQSTRLW